jgi:hypothetical protein
MVAIIIKVNEDSAVGLCQRFQRVLSINQLIKNRFVLVQFVTAYTKPKNNTAGYDNSNHILLRHVTPPLNNSPLPFSILL